MRTGVAGLWAQVCRPVWTHSGKGWPQWAMSSVPPVVGLCASTAASVSLQFWVLTGIPGKWEPLDCILDLWSGPCVQYALCCTHILWTMYGPQVKLAQHTYSNLFGTFLCNTTQERISLKVAERTFSVWKFLKAPNFRNHLYCTSRDPVSCSIGYQCLLAVRRYFCTTPPHPLCWRQRFFQGTAVALGRYEKYRPHRFKL